MTDKQQDKAVWEYCNGVLNALDAVRNHLRPPSERDTFFIVDEIRSLTKILNESEKAHFFPASTMLPVVNRLGSVLLETLYIVRQCEGSVSPHDCADMLAEKLKAHSRFLGSCYQSHRHQHEGSQQGGAVRIARDYSFWVGMGAVRHTPHLPAAMLARAARHLLPTAGLLDWAGQKTLLEPKPVDVIKNMMETEQKWRNDKSGAFEADRWAEPLLALHKAARPYLQEALLAYNQFPSHSRGIWKVTKSLRRECGDHNVVMGAVALNHAAIRGLESLQYVPA